MHGPVHRFLFVCVAIAAVATAVPIGQVVAPAVTAAPTVQADDPTRLPPDAAGNTRRLVLQTGHETNYDETKAGIHPLPELLTFADGRPVRTAAEWEQRRLEIIELYERHVYGHVPASAPAVTWRVVATNPGARGGTTHMKQMIGTAARGDRRVEIPVTLHTPAAVTTPVPVILLLNFGSGDGDGPPAEPPIAAELITRGWGYASVRYQDVQPDRRDGLDEGVIGLALEPGQSAPAPDEWGTIAAWAWGVSRVMDYLLTDDRVDPARIALFGFSRNGKTALWAAARDTRIAAVFSACSGEMGAALSRRDFGETVDDMVQDFPWQFAGAFQQWRGRWADMPVDAHMLIALSAPRPVFLTGGTRDLWADPRGMFLAARAAGPAYELFGRTGLGRAEFPAPDVAVTTGDIGWLNHTGGHGVPATDWRAFVDFLAPRLR